MKGGEVNTSWIEREAKALEEERKKALEERGFRPRFLALEGLNRVIVYLDEPHVDRYGRVNLHVVVDGEDKDWPITRRSPLFRDVISALQQAKTNGWRACVIEFVRTGTGPETRYGAVKLVEQAKVEGQEKQTELLVCPIPGCEVRFGSESDLIAHITTHGKEG